MKNKIVTLLCIMTILITTGIAAANSDKIQHSNDQAVAKDLMVAQNFCDSSGNHIVNDTEALMPGILKDRYVSVVNNSSDKPVFIRTLFAFEAGNLDLDDFHRDFRIEISSGESAEWQWIDNDEWKATTYNNKKFFVTSATYKTSLNAGSTTQASLLRFGLTAGATNETVKQFNDRYTLMVCSQAVQADDWKIDNIEVTAEAANIDVINSILDEAFGQVNDGYQANWDAVTTP